MDLSRWVSVDDSGSPLPGVYRGVPFEAYFAIRALSASRIHLAETTSLCQVHHRDSKPRKSTGPQRQGIALHSLILEGEAPPAIVVPKALVSRTQSPWVRSAQLEEARPLLDAEDLEVLDRVRGWRSHPGDDAAFFRRVLDACPDRELTMVWVDEQTGVRCKGRIDADGPSITADLKSGDLGSLSTVRRKLRSDGWLTQTGFYSRGRAALGLGFPDVYAILALHTREEAPEFGVLRIPRWSREKIQPRISAWMERFKRAEESGDWPGRFGATEIEVEPYAHDLEDMMEIGT